MSGNITGNERGVIGNWPLKEGVGNKIYDTAEGKFHGTITGACWWMSPDSVGTNAFRRGFVSVLLFVANTGQVEVPESTLMEDMKKMYDCELGSDVRLIAADGRAIFAHKIILATRSEAFR